MRTILIGNGPSALSRNLGAEIDAYDRVVRINRCYTKGFEKQLGTKTDVWCVSFHWVVGKFKWPNESPQPRTIVCIHKKDFGKMFNRIVESNAECVSEETASEVESLCGSYYCSTGIISAMLFKPCDIIGFDHWSLGNHYGDSLINPKSHCPEMEKKIFIEMETKKFVRII